MFYESKFLSSILDKSKKNYFKITDIKNISSETDSSQTDNTKISFFDNSGSDILNQDIFNENNKNKKIDSENSVSSLQVTYGSDLSLKNDEINSLIVLPDILQWNTSNVIDMSFMFYKCISLISLPDISNWNTGNANNMESMFYECNLLLSLPDISKWDIKLRISVIYFMDAIL